MCGIAGYWQRDGCAMREWPERAGVTVRFVHSGGHAWPEDLTRLVEAIQAKKVVRVHTDVGARRSADHLTKE